MVDRAKILSELIELCRWLGAPEQDCAILGEGNVSARVSDASFIVKASGFELGKLDETGLVEVDFSRTLAMIEKPNVDDAQVRDLLLAARVNSHDSRLPSVETPLHAACLSLEGVNFVAHSHPTAINSITCSTEFEKLLNLRLFPDQVVVCGTDPLLVPYIDPGVALAQVVQQRLVGYVENHGFPPKTIYLQNHGFIALGSSVKQVKAITAMAVKSARILLGTLACGGPRDIGREHVERIDSRPDEHYRQRIIDEN